MNVLNRRSILLGLTWAVCPVAAFAKDDGESDNSGGGSSGGNGDDDDNRDDDEGSDSTYDHDSVRYAVSDGRAVSLQTLRAFLNVNYPGKIVKISLERRKRQLVYRVRILQAGNKLHALILDARTLGRKWF